MPHAFLGGSDAGRRRRRTDRRTVGALRHADRQLTPEEWDHPSLCAGWRNRDVATHVHLALTISMPRLLLGLAMNKGDFNRVHGRPTRRLGDSADRPRSSPSWDEVKTSARIPPTTKTVEVAFDSFVHHHDICVPIGKDVPSDPERLRWMADGMVAAKQQIGSGPAGRRVCA